MADESLNPIETNGAPTATVEEPRSSFATLGDTEDTSDAALMDPAHKALADALRFTYALVLASMIVLVVLFALSGFQRVRTGESGIALRFGAIDRANLDPGLQFSLPYPMGEILKINTGTVSFDMDDEFFPFLTPNEKNNLERDGSTGITQTAGELDPKVDGYLLTADGSIIHTRWQATYRRTNPRKMVENLQPGIEDTVVRGAIKRAVIHASASMTIDEIYLGQPDAARDLATFRPLADIATQIAQETLDEIDSGITIENLALTLRMPPRSLINEFNSVTKANEDAGTAVSKAIAESDAMLIAAAGGGAETILDQIDRYEERLLARDVDAEASLAIINALLRGESVEIDGELVSASVGGDVSAMLSEAQQYRTTRVTEARADANRFQVKLANYSQNPRVLLHTDWSEAMSAFFDRQTTQMMFIPQNAQALIQLNRDPEIQARIERQRRQDLFKQTTEERRAENRTRQFERAISP